MPTLQNSEVNKAGHSGTSKNGGRIMIICFSIFLRSKHCVNKISSRNSKLYKFLTKIYLESFVFSYHFIIYLGSSKSNFYNLNITLKF